MTIPEKPGGDGWYPLTCGCGNQIGWTKIPPVVAYCEDCQKKEMVYRNGWKIGDCPYCGHENLTGGVIKPSKYTDQDVQNIVEVLELASDNLCQRVINLLWQRDWEPKKINYKPKAKSKPQIFIN